MSSLWILRILFLSLCTLAGLAVSQVRPELVGGPTAAILVGLSAEAAGQAIGYAFGGGGTAAQSLYHEFHREWHTRGVPAPSAE